jgi:hypothetical protein
MDAPPPGSQGIEAAVATARDAARAAPRPPGRRLAIPHVTHHDDDTVRPLAPLRACVADATGVRLEHLSGFSFDPAHTRVNIENFTALAGIVGGVALAGEISPAAAIGADEWTATGEPPGRNDR